jgi:hypothetical protein
MAPRITDVNGNAVRQGEMYILRNTTNRRQLGKELPITSFLYMAGNVTNETETTITAGIHTQGHANTSLLVEENPIYAFRVDQMDENGRMRLVSVWCGQYVGVGSRLQSDGGRTVVNRASDLWVRHHMPSKRQATNRGLYRIGVETGVKGASAASKPRATDRKRLAYLDSWELEPSREPTWWATHRDSSSQWWSFVPFRRTPVSYSLVQLSSNTSIQSAFSVTIQNSQGKYLRHIRPIVDHMHRVPHVRFDVFTPTIAKSLPSSFLWQMRAVNELHHLYTIRSGETANALGVVPQKETLDIIPAGGSSPRGYFIVEHVSGFGESMRFRLRSAFSFTQSPDDQCVTSVIHTDKNSYAMNLDKTKRTNDADSFFTVSVVRDLQYCLQNVDQMNSAECRVQCGDTTQTRRQCNQTIDQFCTSSLKNLLTSDVCQSFCSDAKNEQSCRVALQKLCKDATRAERVAYGADCACFRDSDYYTPMLEKTFPSRLFPREQPEIKRLSPVCWFPDCAKQSMNWKKPKDATCSIGSMRSFSDCLNVQIRKNVPNFDAYKNNLITECASNAQSGGGGDENRQSTRPSGYIALLVCILGLLFVLFARLAPGA